MKDSQRERQKANGSGYIVRKLSHKGRMASLYPSALTKLSSSLGPNSGNLNALLLSILFYSGWTPTKPEGFVWFCEISPGVIDRVGF